MESTIAASTQPQVTVGVDTHKQFHVAHAVDKLGRPLGTHRMAATTAGYRQFMSWAHGLGRAAKPLASRNPPTVPPRWCGCCASPAPVLCARAKAYTALQDLRTSRYRLKPGYA